jgi:DnaK suppressor protein
MGASILASLFEGSAKSAFAQPRHEVGMNKKELAKFKKLIVNEIGRVREKLGVIGDEITDRTSNNTSGNQGHSNHMADIGSDAMEQEQAFLHASQGTEYLNRLEEALKRIKKSSYGVCEDCSAKIPAKRLEAYLAARLCVGCKSKHEKLRRG